MENSQDLSSLVHSLKHDVGDLIEMGNYQRRMSIEDENTLVEQIQSIIHEQGEDALEYLIDDKGLLFDQRFVETLESLNNPAIQSLLPLWTSEKQSYIEITADAKQLLVGKLDDEPIPSWVFVTLRRARVSEAYNGLLAAWGKTDNASLKEKILFAIAATGHDSVAEFVQSQPITKTTIQALYEVQNQAAIDTLCQIVFATTDKTLRQEIVKYLGGYTSQDPAQVSYVLKNILINPDEDIYLRYSCAKALARWKGDIPLNALIEASQQVDNENLESHIYGYLRGKDFLELMEKVQGPIPTGWIFSLSATQKRDYIQFVQPAVDERHQSPLLAIAADEDSDYYLRKRAIRALAQIKNEKIITVLTELAENLSVKDRQNNLDADIQQVLG